jgi:CRISPR-associated endoribonuclease Cas6
MKIYTIKYYFYGSDQIVPFDYKNDVLYFLHRKILGNNNYHDILSLYSISPLLNYKTTENGLLFKEGAVWLIRTPSLEIFKDFYLKSKNAINMELGYGLILKSVDCVFENINQESLITITSPVYLGQNKDNNERDHVTYLHGSTLTTLLMKKTLITKAKELGYDLNLDNFNIEFDYDSPIRTKRILIGGVSNIATQGKVKITGGVDVVGLCVSLGIGLSTGCCFGFCYEH